MIRKIKITRRDSFKIAGLISISSLVSCDQGGGGFTLPIKVPVTIILDQLILNHITDYVYGIDEHDEPYLWVFWIEISEETVNNRYVIRETDPSSGNLNYPHLGPGESANIPSDIGGFVQYPNPYASLIAMTGFLIFIWDHDNSSEEAIYTAYRDVAQIINAEIMKNVDAMELSTPDPKALAKRIKEIITHDYLIAAIRNLSPIEALLPDDMIETYFALYDNSDIPLESEGFNLSKMNSDHQVVMAEINGRMGQRVWWRCNVSRAGPAEDGQIYIGLQDPAGKFDNWYSAKIIVKKEMLDVALTAIELRLPVDAYFSPAAAYTEIFRLYIVKG